jgi:predicted O-methyltransferase YrrM
MGRRDQTGLAIERAVREGSIVSRADESVHELFPVAIPTEEGEALRSWVASEGAHATIETGLGYAVSALFICDGLLANGDPSARHVAIDPYQATRFANCGVQLLEEAGVAAMVELHQERSEIVLPLVLEEGRTFDLAFVDGDHRFDGVFLDLVYLGRLVKPGRVIFVDDYQLPGVARAAAFFVTNLGWQLEEVSPADDLHQWAVLRTSEVPDERPFDHFVDF